MDNTQTTPPIVMTTTAPSIVLEKPKTHMGTAKNEHNIRKSQRVSFAEKRLSMEDNDDIFSIPDKRQIFVVIIVGVCVLVGGLILTLIVEVIIEATNDTETQPRNTMFTTQIKP
ncbi:unnamed protein product [Owenia fusiformis]|uniref:Uncharacterized protein n=1 Tax=Owenia fusiformis TaxID=6347 RepID=A0A8J1UVN4_OWEFU|nr:unnamed protein product [Owenia fusiformis]